MTPTHENLRTVEADKSVRAGRLTKAKQFLQVAPREAIRDIMPTKIDIDSAELLREVRSESL